MGCLGYKKEKALYVEKSLILFSGFYCFKWDKKDVMSIHVHPVISINNLTLFQKKWWNCLNDCLDLEIRALRSRAA